MNGVAAVVSVLSATGPVLQLVALDSITAGVAPQGTALPIIAVESRGATDLNLPSPGATRFVSERVQVTVLAGSYAGVKAVQAAVKRALADRLYPEVSGISGVTIHSAGGGADFMDEEASIYIGTHDFMVKFTETR